jgi:hypothetical protein
MVFCNHGSNKGELQRFFFESGDELKRFSPKSSSSSSSNIPDNSLLHWQIDNYTVAKFYNVSPDEVENQWTNIDFLDRQEYMYIVQKIESDELKKIK